MREHLRSLHTAWITCLLALVGAHDVSAQVAAGRNACIAPANPDAPVQERKRSQTDEIWRIADVVDDCLRRPTDSELTIYTWAHRRKSERMLAHERLNFCAYDRARATTFTKLRFGPTLVAELSAGSHASREQLVSAARGFASDPRLPDLLALAALKQQDAAKKAVRPDELKSEIHLAMLATWLPGALDDVLEPVASRIQAWERRLRDDRATLAITDLRASEIDGTLDGIRQFQELAAGDSSRNRLSANSLGWGVSFSTDPIAFAEHAYDDQHDLIVCKLPADRPRIILDLSDAAVRGRLEAQGVMIRDGDNSGVFVSGYTYYVRPPAAEEALRGRIVIGPARTAGAPVMCDKCALPYPVACRRAQLTDLGCDMWLRLKQRPDYAQGPLRRIFRRVAAQQAGVADAAADGLIAQQEAAMINRCSP